MSDKRSNQALDKLSEDDGRIDTDMWQCSVHAAANGDYEALNACSLIVDALEANRKGRPATEVKKLFETANEALVKWAREHLKSGQESIPADAQILSASDFVIHTSQEVDTLLRAAADGKTGTHWKDDVQALTRTYMAPNLTHRVQLKASDGAGMDILCNLTGAQDADCAFAMLYVSRVLAPPSPLPNYAAAIGWVDLDDIMEKIGWTWRSAAERESLRRRVWGYLVFGDQASVIGSRNKTYYDRHTGDEIPTVIHGPIWRVMKQETHENYLPSLFPFMDPPRRVQLAISQEWTKLTTNPATAQFLPMGERLGSIPGNKPSGAWARVVGLALANFWRRSPREAIAGVLRPTRRELLTRYTPKVAPPSDLLQSDKPHRAVQYWRESLQILVEKGMVERKGEPIRTVEVMLSCYSRKGWQTPWLDEAVDLYPGPEMKEALEEREACLPIAHPKQLARRQPGRPRRPSN